MKDTSFEAIETYLNGNINDARKYFKRRPKELLAAFFDLNVTLSEQEARRFMELMQEKVR